MSRRTPLALRLLAVLMAVVLVAALVLLVLRRNQRDTVSGPTPAASQPTPTDPGDAADDPSPDAGASTDDVGAMDEADALVLLSDVDAASAAGAEELQAAAAIVADSTWAGLDPADAVTGADARQRPVYVAEATVADDRRSVQASVAIAVPAPTAATDTLVLRLLPGASAIVAAGSLPTVEVAVDGRPAQVDLDTDGARLFVTSDTFAEVGGPPSLVRVDLDYEVPDRRAIVDDGGPAGFGLLAHNPDVTVLGHFLPLLTFEDGPMLPYGDVGAFPVATWSLVLRHPGVAVTGGFEIPCPAQPDDDGCLWARGSGLRDLPVAVFDPAVTSVEADGVRVTGAARTVSPAVATQLADESVASRDLFTDLFGDVAWPDLDVVVAPLTSGAAGMEFPGLFIVRTDTVAALSGGFGTYVTVHEVAHQWFHAYLGNGSLGAPVVDESLAQYASYLFYRDAYGQDAADALAERYFVGRYLRWRDTGRADVPPGSPLEGFGDSDVYGPMVYARGALAWLAAEQEVGAAVVVDFIASLVRDHRLSELTVDDVVAAAEQRSADLAVVLGRWWLDPAPLSADELP